MKHVEGINVVAAEARGRRLRRVENFILAHLNYLQMRNDHSAVIMIKKYPFYTGHGVIQASRENLKQQLKQNILLNDDHRQQYLQ
jgi:hypothetical protein